MKKSETKWEGLKANPDNFFGFIYIIHNTVTDKLYIGRKQYHRYVKKKRKGYSDWQSYKGSSKNLHKDMKEYGMNSFKFYIIAHANTRGGLVYAESNLQHKLDVLTDKDDQGERKWLNAQIGSTKFVPKEVLKTKIPKEIRKVIDK